MNKNKFKAQASYADSMFSGVDIYIPEGTEDFVYHRYSYQSNDKYFNPTTIYGKVCRSMIRYAKPSWSKYAEPYFMRHGMREYLSNYMINR